MIRKGRIHDIKKMTLNLNSIGQPMPSIIESTPKIDFESPSFAQKEIGSPGSPRRTTMATRASEPR